MTRSLWSRFLSIFGKEKHGKKYTSTSSCFPSSKRSKMAQQIARTSNITAVEPLPRINDPMPPLTGSSSIRFADHSFSSDSGSAVYEAAPVQDTQDHQTESNLPVVIMDTRRPMRQSSQRSSLPVVIMDTTRPTRMGYREKREQVCADLVDNSGAKHIKLRYSKEEQKYLANVHLKLGNGAACENLIVKRPTCIDQEGECCNLPTVRVRVRETFEPCRSNLQDHVQVELKTFKLQTTPAGVEITKRRELLDKRTIMVAPRQRNFEHSFANQDYLIRTAFRKAKRTVNYNSNLE